MNPTRPHHKNGSVSIALLIIAFILITIVANYMKLTINNYHLTRRSVDQQTAIQVADNATTMGAALFHELTLTELGKAVYQMPALNKLGNRLKDTCNQGDFKVSFLKFAALPGEGQSILITITAGVDNPIHEVRAAVQTVYQTSIKSFFDYSIFTDGIFELSPFPSMNVDGRVRSNSIMRLGGGRPEAALTFDGSVWSSGGIQLTKGWSKTPKHSSQNVWVLDRDRNKRNFDNEGTVLDSSHPNWQAISRSRWGTDIVRADAPQMRIPIGNNIPMHTVIEPKSKDDSDLMKREKMAYKADHSIIVDKNGKIKINGKDVKDQTIFTEAKDLETGVYKLGQQSSWIQVQHNFVDNRFASHKYGEKRDSGQIKLVTVYLDKFLEIYPDAKVVYVEIEDENGNVAPGSADPAIALPALRLRNGNDISSTGQEQGLTIATHRIAYVEGNYNTVDKVPAAIMADNVTVLSNNWNDDHASLPPATSTTYNFGLVSGGYPYSLEKPSSPIQGVQNIIRYYEKWDECTFSYNGAIAKLWNAMETRANACGDFFMAPNPRNVSYNEQFKLRSPPGIPLGLEKPDLVRWREMPYQDAQAIAIDDGNNGHGNDPGNYDPSNPGFSQ